MEIKHDLKIKEGDCFAYKIENDAELKGRYIVLCTTGLVDNPKSKEKYYRVKITKDDKLPNTEEEINNLEDVIIWVTLYENRFYPFDGRYLIEDQIKERSKIKFYPDKQGFLYTYTMNMTLSRIKQIEQFIYLGNFNIKPRLDEFIPFDLINIDLIVFDLFEYKILDSYKSYNLKRCEIWAWKPEEREEKRQFNEELIQEMSKVEKKCRGIE